MAKGHSVSTSSLLLECQTSPLPEQFEEEKKMEKEDEDKNIYVNQIDGGLVQSAGGTGGDDSESTYYITPNVQPTITQTGNL